MPSTWEMLRKVVPTNEAEAQSAIAKNDQNEENGEFSAFDWIRSICAKAAAQCADWDKKRATL